jgi:hypothetical protein
MFIRLERTLGRFAVPHLTVWLIAAQVLVYLAALSTDHRPDAGEPLEARLTLVPDKVLAGEVWRLVTFLATPPAASPVWAFFFWYLFYLMGEALEVYWGRFRYTLYLLIGYAATVAAAFLTPAGAASNVFVEATVFLAFAYLNPTFEIYLFFSPAASRPTTRTCPAAAGTPAGCVG